MGGELRDIVITRKSIRAMVSPMLTIGIAISHPLMQFSGYVVLAHYGVYSPPDRIAWGSAQHPITNYIFFHFIHSYKQYIQQLLHAFIDTKHIKQYIQQLLYPLIDTKNIQQLNDLSLSFQISTNHLTRTLTYTLVRTPA